MWLPSVAERSGPKYLRIADSLAEDVYAGRLKVGERLPTHRELAWKLGVTVGTVSRAYAEAERRGLLVGEVGRGSYVRAGARSAATLSFPETAGPQSIELGINRPQAELAAVEFAQSMAELAASPDFGELLNYQAHTGRWEHRAAGAAWMGRRGYETGADRVLVTSGAQHGIVAAFMAFSDPGDTVLVEELTWTGTRAIASLLRLNLRPVAMDNDGILPDAFDAACRASGARLFFTSPTLHNPTTAVVPIARRREIAEIARRHGITIIEDDVYGSLMPDAPPALSSLAPERSIFITAVSKTLGPCLRIGYVAMPADRIGRFSAAARATNWMAPPLMAEIATRWINDGTADRVLDRVRREASARQDVAARALKGLTYRQQPYSFHVWLELPEPWRTKDIVQAGAGRGLSLVSTDLFVPGRAEPPHAIRVSLTAARDQVQLEQGLVVLNDILKRAPEPCLAVA